jgi:DNA-binding HxlR family transcriptional regulator/putative sterol carrier protein
MYDYEEACPVSKAASVLCERWTLQIVREMLMGVTRFSEFQSYLPKMSPSLLNTRLKSLEQQGLILKKKIPEKKGYEYQLTPCGQALRPLVVEMGKWGMRYSFDSMLDEELNASALVRDFAVMLKLEALPTGGCTFQFNIQGNNEKITKFIILRDGHTQVCDDNPGNEVDVYLTADKIVFGAIWYGKLDVTTACNRGELKLVGHSFYIDSISKWLGISQFAGQHAQDGKSG